jgi:glycosyltransferase 2 family protein
MSVSGSQLASSKKIRPWLLRMVGLLLLAYLFSRVKLGELVTIWSSANHLYLALGVLLAYGMMLAKIERWRRLLDNQHIPFSFRDAARAYFSTYYIGIVTPGRAGELLKILYVRKKTAATLGSGMVSVVLDRMLDILTLVGLAAFGLVLIPQFGLLDGLAYWIAGLTLAAVAGLFLLKKGMLQQLGTRIARVVTRLVRLDEEPGGWTEFLQGFATQLKPPAILPASIYTLMSWAFLLLACYAIVFSLAIQVSFWYMAFAMAVAGLLSLLPVSIAGIGVRDTALVGIFGLVGIGVQSSLAYSLLYFLVFGIVLGLHGAYFWYRYPISG